MRHLSVTPGDWRLGPRTLRGKWSVRLMTGSILLFVAFFLLVASGQKGGDTLSSNPWLAGTILSAAGLALSGGAVGLIAATKDRDRTLGVVVAVFLGLLVVLFVVGEVAFPH